MSLAITWISDWPTLVICLSFMIGTSAENSKQALTRLCLFWSLDFWLLIDISKQTRVGESPECLLMNKLSPLIKLSPRQKKCECVFVCVLVCMGWMLMCACVWVGRCECMLVFECALVCGWICFSVWVCVHRGWAEKPSKNVILLTYAITLSATWHITCFL